MLKRRHFFLFLFSLLAVSSGCASLSKEECFSADWKSIGYKDAANGYSSDQINRHRKACGKYFITPETKSYLSGYRRGLPQYCTPENGWHVGREGHSYAGICPSELENGFLKNYNLGREAYRIEEDIRRLESDLHSDEREMHDEKCTEDRRKDLRRRIRERLYRIRDLQWQLSRAESRRP